MGVRFHFYLLGFPLLEDLHFFHEFIIFKKDFSVHVDGIPRLTRAQLFWSFFSVLTELRKLLFLAGCLSASQNESSYVLMAFSKIEAQSAGTAKRNKVRVDL